MTAQTRTRPAADPGPLPPLLEFDEVLARTRLGKSTIRTLELEGKFPQRIHLSARKVAWFEDEINDWVKDRASAPRGPGK